MLGAPLATTEAPLKFCSVDSVCIVSTSERGGGQQKESTHMCARARERGHERYSC